MLVQLVSRPLPGTPHLPLAAVDLVAKSVAATGVEVVTDLRASELPDGGTRSEGSTRTQGSNRPDGSARMNGSNRIASPALTAGPDLTAGTARPHEADASCPLHLGEATELACAELCAQWRTAMPDVVHTFGLVATCAAVRAKLRVEQDHAAGDAPQVVASFDGDPRYRPLEEHLAPELAGILPLSSGDGEHGAAQPVTGSVASGIWLPLPTPGHRGGGTGGDIVTSDQGPLLDALIDSMPVWGRGNLLLLGPISPSRRRQVEARGRARGVAERIIHLSDTVSANPRFWNRVCAVVAGHDSARHGWQVMAAAAHGVPAIAVAEGAHLDEVIPNATGVLVPSRPQPQELGRAIRDLQSDPLRARGYGTSAQLRTRTLHSPQRTAQILQGAYEAIASPTDSAPTPAREPVPAERCELALAHLPFARQLAASYAGRGQSLEDLSQVAYLGLLLAAERFDPELGVDFHSYAVPTILGELRRHFRDHAWAVRLPRGLQERSLVVHKAAEDLGRSLGHEASPSELAAQLGLPESEVRAAQQARTEAMTSQSLDHPLGDGTDVLADLLGSEDSELEHVEQWEAVRTALSQLPEREREVLLLRFYGEWTQSEIASHLGLTQVQVSRLLTRTLGLLRANVLAGVELPASWPSPHPDSRANSATVRQTAELPQVGPAIESDRPRTAA